MYLIKKAILRPVYLIVALMPNLSFAEMPRNSASPSKSADTQVTGMAQEASNYITAMHDRVSRDLSGQNVTDHDRRVRFRSMLEETFDVEKISRFVLGNHWRTASEAQKQEFKNYFEDFLVKTYSDSFKSYTGRSFKIESSRETPGTGMVLVKTVVDIPKKGIPNEMAPLCIEWRLRKDPNGFKIVDVSVENVSLSITKRQEFGSIIQSSGGKIDGLIRELKEKTQDIRQG